MLKRNLLFAILCLVGLGSLSGMLLRRDRIAEPHSFLPGRFADPDYASVINKVNLEFSESWRQKSLATAPRANDLVIARRLSLALTGTLPSVEELQVLERREPNERLDWWLSHLLEDRRCSDYVAERLARAYVGTDQGQFLLFRRRRFVTWLSDQLMANRRYDELVKELITAKGLWTDSPAVNFLTATIGVNEENQPDDIKLAGRTARAFLGTRIDCLQCHDDKLGMVQLGAPEAPRDGLQSDFHQLAAFYCEAQTSLLGINDFANEYKFKYLESEKEQVVPPRPPFLPQYVPQAPTRREQLATWVTHPNNKPFSRAIVNRMWALLFGKPLVEPIDNIPLDGPFPPGLETLVEDFTAHDFDLHRLIRVIAATDVFQLDSRAEFEVTERHEAAWSAFPLTRLRPEQVAGSIVQSASLTTIDANSHVVAQITRFFQESGFVERYGDLGEDEFSAHPSTITQRLLMMNGDLVKQRTDDNPVTNAATRIAMLAPDEQRAIEIAYLAILTRRPTSAELAHFRQDPQSKEQITRRQAIEDLYWVLINSSEFSWNH
jgi:hypothetical protein